VNFQIQDKDIDATTHLIQLGGEFDLCAGPAFRERVVELVASGKTHILLDLSQGTFLDASNPLGMVMRDVEGLKSAGGSISLICADRSVGRLYEPRH
jgi:anti-sigma B factor antagonist